MTDAAPHIPPLPRAKARRSFRSARAIGALVLREMSTSYGRSPGGYAWAVLEPALGIGLLTLIFAAVFRSPPLGVSFPVFYATGMLPFLMFNDVQGKVAQALLYSRQLMAYPTVTYFDAIAARFLLNTMTQLMVAYLIFSGALLLFETRVALDLPTIMLGFGLGAVLALGIGVLNCYLFTRFEVTQRIWGILMRPAFIVSGIFFTFESIPQPYQDYLWWNPLVHVIGLVRRGFYGTYDADFVSVWYVLGISLVCLSFGLLLLRRHYRDLLTAR